MRLGGLNFKLVKEITAHDKRLSEGNPILEFSKPLFDL